MRKVAEQAEVIRQAGHRLTQSRLAVLQALAEADEPLDAAAILALGRQIHPRLGRVSVYRALELLTGLGLIRQVHGDGGCHGYAWADRPEGHYLICRGCGQVIEFPCQGLEALLESVGRRFGFVVQDHLLQLQGVCRLCREGG